MTSSILLSDNGISSGSAGIKTQGGNDGVLLLQTTTSGGTATTAVTVDNAQNVGVGVTPSAWSGFTALQMANGVGLSGASGSNNTQLTSNAYYNGSAWTYIASAYATKYTQVSGQHQWFNAASGTGAITFTQAMTLDASGNLGVGTTSPAYKLDVNGRVSYNGAIGEGAATTLSSSGTSIRLAESATWTTLTMFTGGTERARIDSSGNWGLGDTTVSNQRQHVKSTTSDSSAYSAVWIDSSANNLFYVRNDGAGYLKAASWTYGSDASLKENIEYLTPQHCLEQVLKAKPATFDYISGEKSNYGYVANDVETWLPEAVPMLESGTRGLKDGFINVLGTGAVQALHQIIQEQQALITTLTQRVEALEGAKA